MIKLSSIKLNPNNPRIIKDDKFKKLVKSISEFPKMMALRPIIVDSDGMILGGNMRFKALKELKYKEVPDEWVKFDGELTDEEKQRFIIEDNVPFGEWDWNILASWDKDKLSDWGMEFNDVIDFYGEGKAGASPWERMGDKNDKILFKFGEIECNLDYEIYQKFKNKCPDDNLAEYLKTIL